jgi:hypothetical protein
MQLSPTDEVNLFVGITLWGFAIVQLARHWGYDSCAEQINIPLSALRLGRRTS